MIVAGVGCRKGASAAAIAEVVLMALGMCGLERSRLAAFATHATKRDEAGLVEIAAEWALPLLAFTTSEMQGVAGGIETISQRVVELKGVPSVAEAAALTAAGEGARLLAPRVATSEATCAIAATRSDTETPP